MTRCTRDRAPTTSPIRRLRRRPLPALLALGLVAAAACASAQQAQPAAAAPALPTAPTADATVNLIRLMVKKGLLTEHEAQSLLSQAQAEAAQVQQAQIQASQAAVATTALQQAQGEQRIRYVPETVKDEITATARSEVLAQVAREGWAKPGVLPPWINSLVFEGDIRLREQGQLYGDDNSDQVVDFASFNADGPFDVNNDSNNANPPFLNTREDRNLTRLRMRLGLRATVAEQWEAGLRLATGGDDSPVSTNQTLGGGLAKKDIWLDRAYLTWRPAYWLALTGGRFRNPFVYTPTLFDDDLNFDGAAALFDYPLQSTTALRLFGTLGATVLESTTDDFPSNNPDKDDNHNKWLFSGQIGVDWNLDTDNRVRAALAYHSFYNIHGRLSEPCVLFDGAFSDCDTDWSRPAFMQKGNTLMLLRQVVLDPGDPATTPQPQLVGLASKFNLVNLNLRYDTRLGYTPLSIEADFIQNLSYDEASIVQRATDVNGGVGLVTNVEFIDPNDPTAGVRVLSGDIAWQLQATFGKAEPVESGDWNAVVGYRRIEPDALPDAFNDSDFHLGGTNAKGYYLGAAWGLARNVWLQGRWLSAQEVFGNPLKFDVLQLDVNARF